MIRNLLYVASETQLLESRRSFRRLSKSTEQSPEPHSEKEIYCIEHQEIAPLKLFLHVVNYDSPIIEYLTNYDIDLIIYDERGPVEKDAVREIEKLKKDVSRLTKTWGPDFNFPMRRCLAILNDTPDAASRSFILGRDHVKEVIVDPHSVVKILRRISVILAADIQQNFDNKVGIALSGGALEGFLYQLGACYALDEALIKKTTRDFDVYSGVSSGSIVGSLLACDIDLKHIIASIKGESKLLPRLTSKTIFDFAAKDIATRILKSAKSLSIIEKSKISRTFMKSIPTGFFKGEGMKKYFENCLKKFSKENDFKKIRPELFVGATDQDTLQHVIFQKSHEQCPTISEAVKASCALPPFYAPQKIGNRRYIDGQVTRTSNLAKVVSNGCRLVIIVDPLKPFATEVPGAVDKEGGIFTLIQTMKALVYSRFATTLSHITDRFPDVDFIVFQPDEETTRIMSGSPMRYKIRNEIIDMAYKSTMRKLISRHNVYKAKLEKHSIELHDIDLLKKLEKKGIEI